MRARTTVRPAPASGALKPAVESVRAPSRASLPDHRAPQHSAARHGSPTTRDRLVRAFGGAVARPARSIPTTRDRLQIDCGPGARRRPAATRGRPTGTRLHAAAPVAETQRLGPLAPRSCEGCPVQAMARPPPARHREQPTCLSPATPRERARYRGLRAPVRIVCRGVGARPAPGALERSFAAAVSARIRIAPGDSRWR
jgi:hypothetical protein